MSGSDHAERQQLLSRGPDLDLGAHLRADAAVVAGGPAAVLDLDSGLDKDWLWADWEDALAVADGADIEVEDCRWTPCYDCGVCPEMGTEIQIGPTGQQLLPLSVV